MNCVKCNKQTKIPLKFAGNNYCEKHYEEILEKRIRKELRTKQKIRIQNKYYIKSNIPEKKKMLEYFLEKIFNHRLKYEDLTTQICEPTLIITTETANEAAKSLINEFLNDEKTNLDQNIKPLIHITDNELLELFKIHKINTAPIIKKDFVDEFEEKYPGTIFSILKTREFLNKKIKK